EVYHALAVADVNDDGVLDLIAFRQDGFVRLSDRDKGKGWDVVPLGPRDSITPTMAGKVRLVAADLDNNGAIDLAWRSAIGGVMDLADGRGGFVRGGPLSIPAGLADAVDLDGDGTLDLLGLGPKGEPRLHSAKGTKGYHWLQVKPRATTGATGDNRINSFALGGEAELRTGVLVVKQPIDRPVVHFGLGSRKHVDLLRFTWTNGALQFEFAKPADDTVVAEQRLKGSCPFLYAWDGERIAFVTDFCWSTPLGMYINGQPNAAFVQTTDWVKVRGDQLRPRNGLYDVRVGANLWETIYLDQLGL